MGSRLIDAEPSAGFNYPYYLCVPEEPANGTAVPVLVEPTNMPGPTDDFEAHLNVAEQQVAGGICRRIADRLGVPLVHPVFPRPVSDPVDWTVYTHSLCRETLSLDETPLANIDEQLLAMVEHARQRLEGHGIETPEQFMMNGFSASGTFANRFTALHPSKVLSVSAGGFNGMAILPVEEAEVPLEFIERRRLTYPVGVADLEEVTGSPFDRDAFRSVPQFLYLGSEDQSDTLRYPDAWTGVEERASAILVYGDDIHDDRFPTCRRFYAEQNVSAVFRVYDGVGHDPRPALDDIVAFHRHCMAGDDIETIRRSVGEP